MSSRAIKSCLGICSLLWCSVCLPSLSLPLSNLLTFLLHQAIHESFCWLKRVHRPWISCKAFNVLNNWFIDVEIFWIIGSSLSLVEQDLSHGGSLLDSIIIPACLIHLWGIICRPMTFCIGKPTIYWKLLQALNMVVKYSFCGNHLCLLWKKIKILSLY